jgi:hypothetical protein
MLGRRIIATFVAVLTLAAAAPYAQAGNHGILVPAVSTPWPGKIFVSHDEWALSDHGIAQSPTARRLALNVAAWFTGGRPGRFLVYSDTIGLTGAELAATMQGAGHARGRST